MSCFNSFCVVLQPRKQNILFWIVGSFVCDINFRWGVYIPGLVEIYVLSMGKRTCSATRNTTRHNLEKQFVRAAEQGSGTACTTTRKICLCTPPGPRTNLAIKNIAYRYLILYLHTRREHAAGKQATQPSSTWQQRCHEESNTQRFYNEIFMNQESCYVTNILDALAEGSCVGRSKGWKVA